MNKNNDKALHIITLLIIVLSSISSLVGLLYRTSGKPYDFVNQYKQTIKMYGNGLYANDSYFMAPIFRGADFAIIFFAIPLLILALILDNKRKNVKARLLLLASISVFLYYATSIAFGITYNFLYLVYIALFSASLFGLIISINSVDLKLLKNSMADNLPFKGINIFLVFTGIALVVAWLPDIIGSLVNGTSLTLIEVYTTSVTYVLDMGIIAPAAFICLYLIKKRTGMGYVLLSILLTVCTVIGIMLPIQTVFQIQAGITIPFVAVVTKIVSFVMLAFFALYLNIKLFSSINDKDEPMVK
jgi:hypothetical protein